MTDSAGRARTRAGVTAVVAGLLAVAGLGVAAAVTDDARPAGVNRPTLTPDPLAGPCWPLPTRDRFDFGYQVRDARIQGTGPERRQIVRLQYDRVDAEDVLTEVEHLLVGAGFEGDAGSYTRRDYGTVQVRVDQFDGIGAETLVRGVLELDLPAAGVRRETSGCPTRVGRS